MLKRSFKNSKKSQLRKMRSLELDEHHIYRLDGVVLPSVSEIMKPLTEAYYSDIDESVMETARIRGSMVHEAIENYIHFGIYDPAAEEYVKHFIAWQEKFKPSIIMTEIMFTNGVYAGTIDMYCMIGGRMVLVDLKVTSKINRELLEVQLAAYKELLLHNGLEVEQTMVLHLKKTGWKYEQIPVNHWKWRELVDAFSKNKGS